MSAPTHITDHAARAVAMLLSTLRAEDPNAVELVSILADIVQDLEDLIWDCLIKRYVETSEGLQLDIWGRVLGHRRDGLADADYRRLLGAWQGALRSQGRRDHILRAALTAIEPDAIRYSDGAPAHFNLDIYLTVPPFTAEIVGVLEDILEAAAPSGVQWRVVEGEVGASFRFDDATRGFDKGKMGRRVL